MIDYNLRKQYSELSKRGRKNVIFGIALIVFFGIALFSNGS